TNNGTGITYYYVGDSEELNNWVQFAGFYWRIIRINGDGTIRMIYQGAADSPTPDETNEEGTGTQIERSEFNDLGDQSYYARMIHDSSNQHGYGKNSTILGEIDSTDTTNLNC